VQVVVADTGPLQYLVLIEAAGERAATRFLEFFAATLRNPLTRRAYGRAVADFLAWCAADADVRALAAIQPLHVATWIELRTRMLAAPSVKQQLAAVRHLLDWLVTGQVVPTRRLGAQAGAQHRHHPDLRSPAHPAGG